MTNRPVIKENFVEYLEGSLPIILSAPHGGTYKPKNIRIRQNGIFEMDAYTKELTQAIIREFFVQTNAYPHTIIMNLARNRVDANRAKHEAVSNDPKSQDAYESFHHFIEHSKQKVASKYGRGIYIDIHGQSHKHRCIEFGYLLHNEILKLGNEKLENYQNLSSIKTMAQFSDYTFVEQLKGSVSLSGLMDKRGFKCIPSRKIPFEPKGDYFEGAYNTLTYSSLNGHCVSAIQAEFPFKHCRDSKANRQKTAKAFVASLIEFMHLHFDIRVH
jgi:uncharacterized protein YwbE